jgi:hypothetical protein
LAIDTLQYVFTWATKAELISPLKGRTARLRLSLYADDVVVFANPIQSDVDMIMSIMYYFGEATGLRVNVRKSSTAAIRCAQIDLDQVLQNFSGQRVTFPITPDYPWLSEDFASLICS